MVPIPFARASGWYQARVSKDCLQRVHRSIITFAVGLKTWLSDERLFMKHLHLINLVGLAIASVAVAQPPGVPTGRPDRFRGYLQAKPALGEAAPDFVLRDLDGNELSLKDLVGKQPIVIEFGSYS